ncbi:hypothetical protein IR083_20815 [Dysgonomonas sp. GY75]|uniref:hypothetical protein n=1 Tax=Dysgonomonas sp. GY75 TaxID=2780419 RepID=UPI00188380C8|nr:hypothetical protein [Dysgonomonas sp. GY75]MBF0651264.1 hypothetical protein [Dysgonomonas sp. GY75]
MYESITSKINTYNERQRKRRPVITESLIKYEISSYRKITAEQSTVYDNMYVSSDGTLVPSSSWWTYSALLDMSFLSYGAERNIYTGALDGTYAGIAVFDADNNLLLFVAPQTSGLITELEFDMPENAHHIYCSYYKNAHEVPIFSFTSVNFFPVDITNFVANWNDFSTKLERDEFSAVDIVYSIPMKFIGPAAELVAAMFSYSEFYAKADITVSRRNYNNNSYVELTRFALDFSGYHKDDDFVELDVVNDSIQEYIKAGKSTKYDIPVSEIKEVKQFNYGRLNIPAGISYVIAETKYSYGRSTLPLGVDISMTPTISLDKYAISQDANVQDARGQQYGLYNSDDDNGGIAGIEEYIFRATEDMEAELHIDLECTFVNNQAAGTNDVLYIARNVQNWNDSTDPALKSEIGMWELPDDGSVTVIQETIPIILKADDKLVIFIKTSAGNSLPALVNEFQITKFNQLSINHTQTPKPKLLDIIKPQTLLQRLLDNISRKGMFQAVINWDETFSPILCCGETLRQFNEPKLHGSLNDLMEWLNLMGYSYKYSGNQMIYSKRANLYDKNITAIVLDPNEVANFEEEANDNHSYTSLEIGYKKETYDKAKGLLDPNATFNYSTGYINSKEKKLSLISPYRADPVGFELILWDEVAKTTDTDSKNDNNIFVLQLTENASDYTVDTTSMMRVIDYNGYSFDLFNGILNPHFLALRNNDRLGIVAKLLKFASTDGYDKARIPGVINGQPILLDILYTDIDVDKRERLFRPVNYTFEAGTWKNLPELSVADGIVQFTYRGIVYRGFINSVEKVYGSEKKANWELLAI